MANESGPNASDVLDAGLSASQVMALREELGGRKIVLCFGGGVDSTALIVVLCAAGIRPEAITFADTGGEKPETIAHVERMSQLLVSWGGPPVSVCRKRTKVDTGYSDLEGGHLIASFRRYLGAQYCGALTIWEFMEPRC